MGVQEEQAAFYAGVQWANDQCPVHGYPELVKAEAAKRYPVKVEAPPWTHQLTREQLEEDRGKLLEAAAGVSVLGALLWSASPAPIWDTAGMEQDFEVIAFRTAVPDVVVRRRSDGTTGTLQLTNRPRFYFGWKPAVVTITPVELVDQLPDLTKALKKD